MEAEKSIVNLWLNNNGFFTINDINAGKSVIDILAIKFSEGVVEKVQHVEVSCSLRGELPVSEYQKRFNSRDVKEKLAEVLKKYIAGDFVCENVLITNAKIAKESIKDVAVLPFNRVLFEVVKELDSQNYGNTVTRSIQIFKYLFLKPELIRSIGGKRFKKALKSLAMEDIDKNELMKQMASDDEMVEKIIKKSSFRKEPKKMAKLMKKLFRAGAKEEFLTELGIEKKPEKEKVMKEKPLKSFYE